MGTGTAALKVPGGKLVKARVTVKAGELREVRITGDFFAHPEESIKELECTLAGKPADPASVRSAVLEFFASRSVVLVGASAADFAQVIERAVERALEGR